MVAPAAPIPAHSTEVGPVSPTRTLSVDVGLEPADPAGLERFDTAVSTPGSPEYHHYLAKGQFAGRFGAPEATIDGLVAALESHGLDATPTPDRLSVKASGTAGQVEAAFQTPLVNERLAGGRIAYLNPQAPRLPTEVAKGVIGVVGLSDVVQLEADAIPSPRLPVATTSPPVSPVRSHASGPSPCTAATNTAGAYGAYTSNSLASAYGFTTAYAANNLGAGQSVALFELEPFSAADVSAFESCYGISTTVTTTNVDGGPGTGAGSGESALDIDVVASLAPSATVHVYQAPNGGTSTIDTYDRIATDDTSKVVSTSWAACEPELAGYSNQALENPIFEEMAAQGQTMVAASGDDGSEACYNEPSTALAVNDPPSQPWVTGVGGTSLTAIGPPPTETVWNESADSYGAGGGGESITWARPAWQTGTGTSGTARQVPDLSASADPVHGYVIYYDGSWTAEGGTSAAAPLTAALASLVDNTCGSGALGFLNPKLYSMATADTGFHDITSGNNDYKDNNGGLYPATTGYDMASGLGSPNGSTWFTSGCQTSVGSASMTPAKNLTGASTTYSTKFTTSGSGAMPAGDDVTLVGPSGTRFTSTASNYTVTVGSGSAVQATSAVASPDNGSSTDNAVVLQLPASVGASTAVAVSASGVTNASTAGGQSASVFTSADQAPVSTPFTLAGVGSAGVSTTSASSSSVEADGVASSTVTVTVRDGSGNLASGRSVTLAQAGGHSVITASPATTNASGIATFTVTDTTVESVTYTPADATDSVTLPTVAVAFIAPKASVATSTVVASPTSVEADGVASSTVTVTLKNDNDVVLAGKSVTLAAGSGSSVITTSPAITNSSGVATFTLTDTTAEAVTYTATDTTDAVTLNGAGQTPTVTFTTPKASIANSTVSAFPVTLEADGVVSSTVTVTLKDDHSVVLAGKSVSLAAGSGSSMITTSPAITNSSGVATFTLTDTTAQAVVYTATDTTDAVTLNGAGQTPTVTFTTPKASVTTSTVVASPTSVEADGVAGSTVTVTLEDDHGVLLAGKSVSLAAGSGSSVITTSPAITNSSGVATFTLTDTTAQAVTYTATDTTDAVILNGAGQTPTVTFTTPKASITNSTVSASPVTLEADGLASSTVTVTLKDDHGVLLAGKSVSLAAGSGSSVITTSPAITNSSGVATFTLTDTTAQAVVYTATDTTDAVILNGAGQTPTVTFTTPKASIANSTVSASPVTLEADGLVSSTVTVTLKDDHGVLLAGRSVSLTAGSGSSVITTSPATTNSSGVATFTLTDTTAQAVTYTATDTTDAVILNGAGQTPTVTFTTPKASITNSTVSASPVTLEADGVANSTVTVTLEDDHGVLLAGKSVSLAAGSGSSVITTSPAITNSSGVATFTLTDTTAQAVTYTATDTTDAVTLNGAGQIPTVTFTTPKASIANSTVSASPVTLEADGLVNSTVTVTLKDDHGVALAGKSVSLAAGSGHSDITGTPAITNSSGVATFTLTDTSAEAVAYTATDTTDAVTLNGAEQTPTVTFTTPKASVTTSTVVASPTSVEADGVASSTVTVTLEDDNGVLLAGKSVSLVATSGSSVITTSPAITNSSGVATFTVTDTTAQAVTYTATDTSDAVTLNGAGQSPTVIFASPQASSARSTVNASPSTVETDGTSSTVTVTLKDDNGVLLAGKSVSLAAGSGSSVITTSPATTNGSGVATFTLTDTTAQAVVYTATDTTDAVILNGAGQTPTVTFTAPKASVTTSTVAVSPPSVEADGVASSTVTVTLEDDHGVALAGRSVSLAAGSGSSVITTSPAITNSSGVATFTLTDTTAEAVTYTATDTTDAVTLNGAGQTPTVTFTSPKASVANSTVAASPSSVEADGLASSTVTVTLEDDNGVLQAGKSVSLAQGTGHSVITTSPATTNSSGVATFVVTDTSAETVTYTATDTTDAVTLNGAGQTPTVTFTSPRASVANSTVTAAPSSVEADGVATSSVTVTLKDDNGVALAARALSLAAGSGSSVITTSPATTNSSGVATFSLTDTTAQAVTYTATDTTDSVTLNGAGQTPTVNFTTPTVVLATSTVAASPSTVDADGSAASTITVTLRDAAGVGMPGRSVALGQGTGHSVITTSPATTNTAGVATFTVADATPETVTYTATDSSDALVLSAPGQQPQVIFSASEASVTNSTVTASPLSVEADGLATATVTVALEDRNGAVVPGKSVSLAQGTGHSVITTSPSVTNASGVASFVVTDTTAELVTYTATDTTDAVTLNGTGQTPTVTFTSPKATVANSTVTATPSSVEADGVASSTVTVTLKDDNGVALSGRSVSLVAGSGSSVITASPATTNTSGMATFTVKDATTQAVTYTVTDTTDSVTLNGAGQTPTVTFTSPKATVANSTVVASPSSVEADGVASLTVTITLKDDNGVALGGRSVSLAAGSGSSVITTSPATTNGSGIATFTVTDTTAEAVTYTATDTTDSVTLNGAGQTPTVTFTSPRATAGNSTVVASPTSVEADGVASSTVTATLKDDNGVALAGRSVSLAAGSGSSVITTSPATTNPSGIVTFTVSDTTAQAVTYTATDTTDSVTLNGAGQTPTVTFTSPKASVANLDGDGRHPRRWRRTGWRPPR